MKAKVYRKQARKVYNVDQIKAYQAARHCLNYCSFPIWKYYVEHKGLNRKEAKAKLRAWIFAELGKKSKRPAWNLLTTEESNKAANICYSFLLNNRSLNNFSRCLEYPGPWPMVTPWGN